MDCVSLSNVTIGNGEITIGKYAFSWCLKLKELTIRSNALKIDEYAFYACDGLERITIESMNLDIFDSADTLPPNAKIIALADSTVEKYALKYDRSFEIISKINQLGDVDLDSKVTIMDATSIQQHLALLATLSDESLSYGDTDYDGDVTIMDATKIQLFLASLIPQL